MMMKGLGLDESMSNLTSTVSGETSISSTTANTMLYPRASSSSFASQVEPPRAKKRRSLPGNPDPESEVIALSPKSLLATNRFICEICNKGFQRDQNLQLHKRGHNLPWKLKKRAKDQIIRKKVYVCPVPSCVHHDQSRALGDLTGVKKHYCRKHGEKKWKCVKCSKKYAVQSDWKAHSKICGTREYRCDCGTLFSRRDSFITHRAFCDTLAEDNARGINPLITLPSVPHAAAAHQRALQSLPLKKEHDTPPWLACPPLPPQQTQLYHHHHHHQVGPGTGPGSETAPAPPSQMDGHVYFSFEQYDQSPSMDNAGPTWSSFEAPPPPQMSATALLRKAEEMGVAVNNQASSHGVMDVSNNNNKPQPHTHMSISVGLSSSREGDHHHHHHHDHHQSVLTNTGFMEGQVAVSSGGGAQSSMLHDMMIMSSMQSTVAGGSGFDGVSGFGDFHQHHHQGMAASNPPPPLDGGKGGGGLTRDFLGLRTFSHKDFLNMARLGAHMSSSSASFDQQHDHHHQNQTPR